MIEFLPLGGAGEIGANCYYLNIFGNLYIQIYHLNFLGFVFSIYCGSKKNYI